MLPPQLGYALITAQQQLHRSSYLHHERQQFAYLPALDWMQRGKYEEVYAGDYRHGEVGEPAYRVSFLSQSGLCLLYYKERFLQALCIGSDEELLRLLLVRGFPLPR
ncbi:MAG: hypothetical protein EOO36_00540 [Cytophagaceae bacterium]|nr:MAG: hypothetical protein EOO36_00540 [Cytophagaceae bacterium]